ncbi:MAG TPA: lipoate--protein ligase, partial [Clostridiaceae bacterium]|nr:lipoate--protein ligase [Clostridiaceae bacterium]
MTKFYYIMKPDLIDAATAFAVEDYLLTLPIFDNSRCFLAWRTPPTVMIGRYQNPWGEVHFDQLEKNDVELIRRQTGGGTIFTDPGSIQFSFISSRKHRGSDAKQENINFKRFLEPVMTALNELGYPVEMDKRNDLLLEGAKFCGNAQYLINNKVLHHGSLLYDSDLDLMFKLLQPPSYKLESKGIKSVRQRVMNLSDYAGVRPVNNNLFFNKFAVAAINKAADDGNELEAFHLSEADKKNIRDIRHQKYKSYKWNYSNSSSCTIKNEIRADAGRVTSYICIDEGRIESIHLEGDFFCQNSEQLAQVIDRYVGSMYDPTTMRDLITNLDENKLLFRIDKNHLFDLFFPEQAAQQT